jgi:hypothetical protein
MFRLQEKVYLTHETVGWEFVIDGLLNQSTYTRMVTVNLPLAIYPVARVPAPTPSINHQA